VTALFPTLGVCARAALFAGLLLCSSPAFGQDVTELSLKAAFIHNFLKFTEWPIDVLPAAAPLVACVLGNAPLGDVLGNYVSDRNIGGHAVVVSQVAVTAAIPRLCHVLYVSGITTSQAAQVAASLNGASVLTLSDVDGFAQVGGVAQLYVEGGRIRFRINLDTARRDRLQFSSKLLALATLVKDNPSGGRR
jgi:hypothetical protein